jgi:hypothetical protein
MKNTHTQILTGRIWRSFHFPFPVPCKEKFQDLMDGKPLSLMSDEPSILAEYPEFWECPSDQSMQIF